MLPGHRNQERRHVIRQTSVSYCSRVATMAVVLTHRRTCPARVRAPQPSLHVLGVYTVRTAQSLRYSHYSLARMIYHSTEYSTTHTVCAVHVRGQLRSEARNKFKRSARASRLRRRRPTIGAALRRAPVVAVEWQIDDRTPSLGHLVGAPVPVPTPPPTI